MNHDVTSYEQVGGPKLEILLGKLIESVAVLSSEINLLSGRVDLVLRTNARIIGKIDPSYLDDPHAPGVRERSRLLGETVLNKMKAEALAQASVDPDQFSRLQRYFKDDRL